MKIKKKIILVCLLGAMLLGVFAPTSVYAQDGKFTVVLDAGHGGHDPGAMGSFMREKDINLAIVLELGAIIERNFKDVKVVYSRKTDKYLTLQERADVVNNNHADLFLCIHTNSNPNPSASGTESYTLGLAKTKANLDVAMRENSVIMLEKDYQSKYKGFDPNSVDSYIMFEFMQDKYIDKSLDMASNVQKQFVSFSNRTDRGVRQAGFWVLHRSACPSVLIEVGFVSNPAEERYLSSDIGRNEIAKAIYNAFIYYKHDHDKKSGIQNVFVPKREVPEPKEQEIKKIETLKRAPIERAETTQVVAKTIIPTTQLPTKTQSAPAKKSYDQVQSQKVADTKTDPTKNLTFKVQLFATRLNLNPNAAEFKGVQNVEFFVENGLKKYTLGAENEYPRIEKIRASILSKFPDAFVIVFDGDRKLSPKEAALLTK
jgi:N-acetylmuramoyl-L-alanine amidase